MRLLQIGNLYSKPMSKEKAIKLAISNNKIGIKTSVVPIVHKVYEYTLEIINGIKLGQVEVDVKNKEVLTKDNYNEFISLNELNDITAYFDNETLIEHASRKFDNTQEYDKVDEYVVGYFEVLEIGNGRIYL